MSEIPGQSRHALPLRSQQKPLPKASVIGLLVNPNYPEASLQVRDLEDAAGALGLQISVANADTENGVDAAMAGLHGRVSGVF